MKTQVCVNAKKNKKMKKSELRKLIKQMIPEQVGRTPQGGMPQGGNEIFIRLDNHPQAENIKQMMGGKGPGGTSKKPQFQITFRPFGIKIRFTAPWHW